MTKFFYVMLLPFITWAQGQPNLQNFPDALKKASYFEQVLIGPRNIEADTLDVRYQPEQRLIFETPTYWVDQEQYTILLNEKFMPKNFKQIFFREHQGHQQVLISVHPDEKEYFSQITSKAAPGKPFIATASASPRSLISVAASENEWIGFYNKLSVNKQLGGNIRLISKKELARSFFVTEILDQSEKTLPKSFRYYPEFLVMIPKNMDRGGTILRSLPEEVLNGTVTHIPFFALYADQPDGSKPLILKMAEKSNQSFMKFYETRILYPFLEHWFDMALEQGITSEPHGQNLMLVVNQDGMPTGQFNERDFGGFTVDLEYRKKLGLPVPPAPEVNGYKASYSQEDVAYGFKTSLDLYFGNFVGQLAYHYETWCLKGWMKTYRNGDTFYTHLAHAIEKVYERRTGEKLDLQNRIPNLEQAMFKAQKLYLKSLKSKSCQGVMKPGA